MATGIPQKYAVRRLVRGADGQLGIIWVDLNTYLPVTDTTGYTLLDLGETPPEPVADVADPDAEKPVDKTKELHANDVTSNQSGGFPERPGFQPPHTPGQVPTSTRPSTSVPTSTVPSASTSTPSVATPTAAPSTGIATGSASSSSPSNTTGGSVSVSTGQTPSSTTPSAPSTEPGSNYGVGFVPDFGPNRPNAPKQSIISEVQKAVSETLGPGYKVVGKSGTEDPGKQYGSSRHKTGLAMDATAEDPSGKTVSKDQMQHVAAQFAYNNPTAGIGYGPGYMKEAEAHLDLTGSANSWGAKNTVRNMDPADKAMFSQAREAGKQTQEAVSQGYKATPGFFTGAVPTANPGPSTNKSFVSQDERTMDTSGKKQSVFDSIGPTAQNEKTTASSIVDTAKSPTSQAERQTVTSVPGSTTISNPGGWSQTTRTGTLAFQNNNPGNLRSSKAQIGTNKGFAVFSDVSVGKAAQSSLLFDPKSAYANLSVKQAITKYAPPTENNTNAYVSAITAAAGVSPDTKLSNMTAAQQKSMLDAMGRIEGYKAGKVTVSDTPKGAAARTAYTGPGTGAAAPTEGSTHFGGLGLGTPAPDRGAGYTPGGMNSPSGSSSGYSGNGGMDSPSEGSGHFGGGGLGTPSGGKSSGGYGTGAGTGSSPGGSAGQSGGGGYSPGGMNSPSGSGFGSPSSSSTNSGLGGPTSNNSGNKSSSSKGLGSGANTNGQGTASAGSKSRSEGWF
jgi:hypothetical protein